MTDQDMLNMREVCRFFGGAEKPLDQSTIYLWVRMGKLAPAVSLGYRNKRWRREDCVKLLEEIISGKWK